MRGGNIGTRIERDAAELLVVEFQRLARLLDVPVRHARPRDQSAQERLDLPPAEFAPLTPGVFGEEATDPPHAVGNRPLMGAGLPENLDVALRPARFRIQRRGRPIVVLTHSRSPVFPDMHQHIPGNVCISMLFLTDCGAPAPL